MKDTARTTYGMTFHEAAHAVARSVLRIPIESVRIWSEGPGVWWSETLPPLSAIRGSVPTADLLVAVLAGAGQEELLFGVADDDYHPIGGDQAAAKDLVAELPEDTRSPTILAARSRVVALLVR